MGWFGYLSAQEQWDLHKYFLLTEHLSDVELLEHRRTITEEKPSLPQRAGRAFSCLEHGTWKKVPPTQLANGRSISVQGIMRPKPDLELLAKAVVLLATAMMEEELDEVT
ncbi:hypothetical protein [Mycobacteroides abscessus]|uniref:hypothetical protein n=1 Tax=Mycobacteroides abscessus TaxID=36809 RepID=UPI0012FFE35D|nr:hypothetical protein [Mycobacteroides abscessus]